MASLNMWADILNAIWSIFQTKIQTKNDLAPVPAPLPDLSVHMNTVTLKLQRTSYEESGVYGILSKEDGTQIAVTLEHSYNNQAKIPLGKFECDRSPHRLHNMTEDFITFQVMNVPGHSNILFHWGNYNRDSDGCILLGSAKSGDMIINSKVTWQKFMDLLEGQNSFILEVS